MCMMNTVLTLAFLLLVKIYVLAQCPPVEHEAARRQPVPPRPPRLLQVEIRTKPTSWAARHKVQCIEPILVSVDALVGMLHYLTLVVQRYRGCAAVP